MNKLFTKIKGTLKQEKEKPNEFRGITSKHIKATDKK